MKYFKITEKVQNKIQNRQLPILDYDNRRYETNSVIADERDQNRLRQMIAILRKHGNMLGQRSMDPLDLSIMRSEDGEGYRLMTNSLNWHGRASYYAGIIVGVLRCTRRKKKRRVAV